MHLSFLSDVPTCGGGVIGEGSIKSYSFFHNMSDVPGLICMWIRSNECEGNGAYAQC